MNCCCQEKIKSCSLSLCDQSLTGKLANQLSVSGQLSTTNNVSGAISLTGSAYPYYDGIIEITPVVDLDILLETKEKIVTDNIIVHEIPYYQTSNLSGGYTVIIG